jgi:hypothetical protein
MTTDYYNAPIKVRYEHVGHHRNLNVTYSGRKVLYAVLLALSFDLGFFMLCSVTAEITEQHHGTIVRYHPVPISPTAIEVK